MAKDIFTIKKKFDHLLRNIKGKPMASFTKMVEVGFEALVCVNAINEYATLYGNPILVTNPKVFLNQKPGRFIPEKSFKVEFSSETFYFATDVECFGLAAMRELAPVGDKFEADLVIIKAQYMYDIQNNYNGYPAPQHLHATYECKFGKYSKSQQRELLGFRRHVSYCRPSRFPIYHAPFGKSTLNSVPEIQIIMFRPLHTDFFQYETAKIFDLHQVII
ncbi:hypothetical protein ASU31_00910 [Pedobacter ginsenosidimutans]|uniref:Uncharacterized protein n=1 Tax=Pedobacter ginsenosidimutans TaxID=687842 RepID=A0A0T5VVI4_9SPHI|nr:hypothetical protein [Pedobacter ginsenosidimutans]KRT17886.1 hypothetical protein ASU31_00910 [Pedobacter ginsenosidimutans]